MKTILIAATLAASLAIAAAPTPAIAQSGGQQRVAVSHADLDLTTAQGRSALDLRILHAARAACGTPSPADPRGRASLNACVAEARATAAAERRRHRRGAAPGARGSRREPLTNGPIAAAGPQRSAAASRSGSEQGTDWSASTKLRRHATTSSPLILSIIARQRRIRSLARHVERPGGWRR